MPASLRDIDPRAHLRSAAPAALGGVLLIGLLLLARDSLIACLGGVAIAAFVLFVAGFGHERSGRHLVVAGLFFAPMSALVVPVATFVTATDVLFALGFTLLVPTLLGSRMQVPMTFTVGVFITLAMGTLATLASSDLLASFDPQMRFVAGVVVVPLAFMAWAPSLRTITHLAMAYCLGSLFSIGYGVVKNGERPGARFIGLTEHPNILGMTGLLALALVPFILSQVSKKWQWLWFLVAAASGATVWFSGSRAALLVAAVIVVMYVAIERAQWTAGWMLAAAGVALLFSNRLAVEADSALARILGGGSANFSDAQRSDLLEHYWELFGQRPMTGWGFEEAVLGHNVYLEIAYSMGVVGLVGFLLILLAGSLVLFTAPPPLHR
ncbi:MAG: O-antigen ligase family protein, partial [Nocardioides sp.]|nr:O-antigen ligase family protein [Nocardioides sp.]